MMVPILYLPVVIVSQIFYHALHFYLGLELQGILSPRSQFKHTKFECCTVGDSLPTPNVTLLTPLNPNIKIKILICCRYTFTVKESGRGY